MSHEIIRWLHIMGVVLSLGSAALFSFGVTPALQIIEDRVQRMKVFAKVIQVFHPMFLFGICLTFMTGAMRLTDLKIGFGTEYYQSLGSLLMTKFGLTTLIFLIGSGQCFGMGLKVTRMANGVMDGPIEKQEKLAGLIRKMTIYNVVLMSITVYVGLKIIPMIYNSP
ncbi:MAG: hypothetical protein IPJ69_04910 [Deltaproteobacteria bacterium]|nr:MAG: hypothetical protein IPJ69_04910 [Deltaproteobacteria bacterium]